MTGGTEHPDDPTAQPHQDGHEDGLEEVDWDAFAAAAVPDPDSAENIPLEGYREWQERESALSVFDWDGEPDPGCPHPWYRLDFVEDNQGLGCSHCGRAWFLEDEDDARESLLVVWQSARLAFEQQENRHKALSRELEQLIGKSACAACDQWFTAELMLTVGDMRCCPEHLGEAVARTGGRADAEDLAAGLLAQASRETDLDSHWLVERNISSWGPLQVALGRDDEEFTELPVTLDQKTAAAIGLSQDTTVGELVSTLAGALDLPQPVTRPAMVFLLGLAAESRRHTQEQAESALNLAFPDNRTHRAVIVIDLCRDDVPDEVSFTGDMADDLVRMIGARALELLHAEETIASRREAQ